VIRDWRQRPCLTWTDAERLLLRLRRDREQAARERAELLAEQEHNRGPLTGPGVVGLEVPGYRWQAPWVKDKFDHGEVEVPG
jgi:aminoglycoside phosphotransferase (APT) family kinase protein